MKKINIKTIRINGGTQSRVEINNEIVTEYAEAIKAGSEFPAVVVFNDGADNWLADGFHRFHAHNQAGKTSIAADVRQGTARDAILFSLGANGTHGLNRTNADKRKAVETMLNDTEWAKWSNVAVAKACFVSEGFVRSLRINEVTTPAARTYTTKHGTPATMQTANIGRAPAPAAKPVLVAVAPVLSPEDEYTPLDEAKDAISILSEENDRLNDRLAVASMDATDEERAAAATTLDELRKENKMLRALNKQLTISRDSFQNQAAEMQRQINRQRRELDRATGLKTA